MSGGEIVVIVFVALLLFGSKAIPDVAKTFGKAMREFQKATNEIKREIKDAGGLGDEINDIKSTINSAKSDIQDGVRKHTSDIQDGVKEATSDIQEGYNGYADYAGDYEKEISKAKKDVAKGAENMTNTIENGAQI